MASILGRVGFPFCAPGNMPSTICSGTVYTWKENFIQGAGWKKHRLTLFEDGTLVWDDAQTNRLKASAQLTHIFRRIGIGTLYNSVDQQKAAVKHELTIQEYGLLLPFSRGDGGLELSQFAVTSVSDIHRWMDAFAKQMSVSHLLAMVVENRLQNNASASANNGRRDSIFASEKFWLEDVRSKDRKPSITPVDSNTQEDQSLASLKAADCADVWHEFQETYHVCMSAQSSSVTRQRSVPLEEHDDPNGMRRTWSTKTFTNQHQKDPKITEHSYGV